MIQEIGLMSEQAIIALLGERKDFYAPLEIISVEPEKGRDRSFDAQITLGWRGRSVPFLAEIKTRTAPKIVNESVLRLKSRMAKRRDNLLLVVPFLSKTVVEILERERLSGLDLNGNYLIQTPDMMAIRLDRSNQFRESQPIKKIFSGSSSLVGRLFLSAKRRFTSVGEVRSAIGELGGSLSLSAVSKVLAGLENEMIIEKGRDGIALLQPEKLLQSLKDAYRPPKATATMRLKLPATGLAAVRELAKIMPAARWVVSGESSVHRYAVTTATETFTVFATDQEPPWLFSSLKDFEDERFFNVTMKKISDTFPYFDTQEEGGLRWASPVQCYLELSKLDKREQEIAATVREAVLSKLK